MPSVRPSPAGGLNKSSRASIKILGPGQLPRRPTRFGLTFGSVTATDRQTSSTLNRSTWSAHQDPFAVLRKSRMAMR
jgi:hypothetical protein